jgi:uncharacterized protein (UPF0276 family)
MTIAATAGIGFRRDFGEAFLANDTIHPGFIEVAPENWMQMGGYWKQLFDRLTAQYPLVTHGLSLSIGSPDPLDWDFLAALKQFLDHYHVRIYSEHLSYSKCDNAHVYDLLPIPFREDAVRHVSERIRTVQDYLERPVAIENVSYYTPVAPEMGELDFLKAILAEADCQLLLDINNVYVNAFNHGYDARTFLDELPLERVAYIHMAGHHQVEEDLIIDTHGNDIIDPVYALFDYAARQMPPVPVLLERDFNIPELSTLQDELCQLEAIIERRWGKAAPPAAPSMPSTASPHAAN